MWPNKIVIEVSVLASNRICQICFVSHSLTMVHRKFSVKIVVIYLIFSMFWCAYTSQFQPIIRWIAKHITAIFNFFFIFYYNFFFIFNHNCCIFIEDCFILFQQQEIQASSPTAQSDGKFLDLFLFSLT